MEQSKAQIPSIATHDIQIGLLKRFKLEGTEIALRTMSGRRLIGKVKNYDTWTIEFQTTDNCVHLLYKHGIEGFETSAMLKNE
jgi:sRNA-binding regulator protein Hfq